MIWESLAICEYLAEQLPDAGLWREDPAIRAIARAIPGARLVLFDGMGHELPEPLWDDIVGELQATFAHAG